MVKTFQNQFLQEECHHSYDKKCHTSYSTEYESQQEEECEDNYKKACDITYSPQAQNVTVRFCMTPLVKVGLSTIGSIILVKCCFWEIQH
jgi:hypothetical protein